MRNAQAVHVRADVIARGFVAGDPGVVARVTRRQHMVIGGDRVLGRGVNTEIVCQAHAEPVLDRAPIRVGEFRAPARAVISPDAVKHRA